MKLWLRILGAGILAGGILSVQADDARKLNLPVPIGHDVKGLRVPVRTTEGKMDMDLQMETARRIDDDQVEVHQATIQTYNQQTQLPDIKIELKNALMNTATNLITSQDPIRVTRTDFELTGDSMEFNSKTRQGRVIGNVRMLIFNRDELQKKTSEEPADQ